MKSLNHLSNIMVPTDFSTACEKGVPVAAELAALVGATLHILSVISDLSQKVGAEEKLNESAAAFHSDVNVKVAVLTGRADEELSRYVTDNAIDMVVLGGGRGDVTQALYSKGCSLLLL